MIEDSTVEEDAGLALFSVSVSIPSSVDIFADFTTTNDTALAASDYMETNGTLRIAAGQTTGTVSIPILDDTLDEGDETFHVVLSDPINAEIANARAVGTILDNDDPPHLSVDHVVASEAAGEAVFIVSLTRASDLDVMLDFVTADSSAVSPDDYAETCGSLTIPAGELSGTIVVGIRNDDFDEHHETFELLVTDVINASIVDPLAIGVIRDDDAPPVLSMADIVVDEDSGQAVVEVTLSSASGLTVTMDYTTKDGNATAGSDYVPKSDTLEIPAGETSGKLAVEIIDDEIDELHETLEILAVDVANATIDNPIGVIAIRDDDNPPIDISLDNASVVENADGALVGRLTVNDPDAGDTHTLTVSDPRFEVEEARLKLKAGQSLDHEAEASVSLNITAVDSDGLELTRSFVLTVEDVN